MVQQNQVAELSALVSRYESSRATDSEEMRQLREENAELLERMVRCSSVFHVILESIDCASRPGPARARAPPLLLDPCIIFCPFL